jgi:hypothetical protein
LGKDTWRQLTNILFDDDGIEDGVMTFDFWAYLMLRVAAGVLIPLWLLVGLVTCGWLWPPQVRESLMGSRIFAHTTDLAKEDELRRSQVALLSQEVFQLKEDILLELASDRTHLMQLRAQVAERRAEISSEMRDIKRLVALLFERQAET